MRRVGKFLALVINTLVGRLGSWTAGPVPISYGTPGRLVTNSTCNIASCIKMGMRSFLY
jgi:hypothetical protein